MLVGCVPLCRWTKKHFHWRLGRLCGNILFCLRLHLASKTILSHSLNLVLVFLGYEPRQVDLGNIVPRSPRRCPLPVKTEMGALRLSEFTLLQIVRLKVTDSKLQLGFRLKVTHCFHLDWWHLVTKCIVIMCCVFWSYKINSSSKNLKNTLFLSLSFWSYNF